MVRNTRISAANPAALTATDIKPVTGVGAPWYTSGVHMCSGTAATLKPKPITAMPAPAMNSGRLTEPPASAAWMPNKSVCAVLAKINATPYSRKAEARQPSRKYLSAASSDSDRGRAKPASTYSGIESSSSARKTMIMS